MDFFRLLHHQEMTPPKTQSYSFQHVTSISF